MQITKKYSLVFYALIFHFIFNISNVHAQTPDSLIKIDVLNAVNTGEATLSATEWDIGNVTNCFDGDTTSLMRSANINPAFVQIQYDNPISISKIRVLLGQPGYPNIDKNDWWVEIADNQSDMISKAGTYQLIIPKRHDVAGEWDEFLFSSPATAKLWKFNIERTVGDDYVHIAELELWSGSINNNRFLIIVSNPLYQTGIITDDLNTYQQDILKEGWLSTLITVNKNQDASADYYCPTEKELKAVINSFYLQAYAGFVIIGSPDDIPTAYWRHHKNRNVDNPTDLYYADMDEWVDLDSNGVYETWDSKLENGEWVPDKSKPASPNNPHFYPELFFGRITAGPISSSIEEEANRVAFYLDKIHDYRINGSNLTSEQLNRALFFRADEYCPNIWDIVYGAFMPNIYCNHGIMMSDPDNLTKELQKGYLFATIVSHSGNTEHAMHKWTNAYREYDGFSINDVSLINPKVHYINLFACSAAKFTKRNFGAAYLFNTDYALNVSGSTGLWGILLDNKCGQELNNGIPVGIMIKNFINRDYNQEGWPKGILHGDPLIKYEINNFNKPPRITNKDKLNYLETFVGENFQLTFSVIDPENDPVFIEIDSLPENAQLNGNTLSWTPSWDQVDSTFNFKAKAIDSYNNSYTAGFSIYVNYFKNGLLNDHTGWIKLGNGNIYLTNFSQPFKCKGTCIETNSSWGALEQTIKVDPFTWYKLEIWADNKLTVNPQNAYIKIAELNHQVPIEEIIDHSVRYDDNFYCRYTFISKNNNNLTISLHSGDENNLTSGKIYLTGLRLVNMGSLLSTFANGDFESGTGNSPDAWTTESFNRVATFEWESNSGRNGSHCVSIEVASDTADDARWIQDIQLLPDTTYRLSGWIKGENIVQHTGYNGANLSIINVYTHTPPLSGSFDWTHVQIEFTTPTDGIVTIGCRLGYFGSTVSGKAWFDDISISLVDSFYTLSGNVYYNDSARPVPNVELSLDDSSAATTATEGDYLFQNVLPGIHKLLPSKTDDIQHGIKGSDVLLLMQSLAYITTLTDHQKIAGDVTLDGNISGADVLALLRYLAYFTTNIAHTSEWFFVPPDTTFDLTSDSKIDFSAYLLGDVNLDWGSGALLAKHGSNGLVTADMNNVSIQIGKKIEIRNKKIHIPITINSFNKEINTLLISITYDPAQLKYKKILVNDLPEDFQFIENSTETGKLHLAMAGVNGIQGDRELLKLVFELKKIHHKQLDMKISRAVANDMEIINLSHLSLANKDVKLPQTFKLSQNYPNPFNSETNIQYQLPENTHVNLTIYNSLGQKIKTLVENYQQAGFYTVRWDGRNNDNNKVVSGIYLYRIEAGSFVCNKKLAILK